jgi:L-seryl-tRNA(Ser) seleniumtransferase
MSSERLRDIPSVDVVLAAADAGSSSVATDAVRSILASIRADVRGGAAVPAFDEIVGRARAAILAAGAPSLRRVINATGVILQTNLGRAPLSERAIAAMQEAARGYTNLEYDLDEGSRGSRHEHVRDLIRRTTGAEDGLVVNNNAAGLFMALQVFGQAREIIVSRGQAVEIGGGFRIPDVLRQSGARLVEVGTTNRTYARDYAEAVTGETAAILRVHSSNFRVVGFTAEAALEELAELARERGVMLLDDLGSGCLVRTEEYGLGHEPTVQESIQAGVDLALFSGDKLLGGPQCGILAGRAKHVEALRRHPLARALRVDKLTIAALNATLMSYAEGHEREEIPVWRMVAEPLDALRLRAERWADAAGEAGAVLGSKSMVGGGSLPGEGMPTWCAAIQPPRGATEIAAALRRADPPVLGRLADGALLLDPRTVDPGDDGAVEVGIREAVSGIMNDR